ncbi:MAG: hypothetical protein AAF530_02220 [Pseudomonadota bacterium]
MPTPDGISDEDWDEITRDAYVLVNSDDSDRVRIFLIEALLESLECLTKKYGRKASIIATIAEFSLMSDSPNLHESEALFKEAYELACETSDDLNKCFISHSLAELYDDKLNNPDLARYWVGVLGENLRNHPEDFLEESYEELAAKLVTK